MPAIFHRNDNKVIELLPTYPSSLPMSGRYVVDYPDHFEIEATNGADTTNAQIVAQVENKLREKFVSFDYFMTNNLLSLTDFSTHFESDVEQTISIVDSNFFPINANNQEVVFTNSYKNGDAPNCLSVMGRFPRKNHIEGATIQSLAQSAGNNCIITKEIDIASSTLDNLGRTDFFLYFRSALQSYVKDRSLSDTEKDVQSPLTSNRRGQMSYTHTQYDSSNRLRCFISSDGGNTYQEIENLKVFSFNGRVDTIRLAWVNYTDADLTLLSYTLMY